MSESKQFLTVDQANQRLPLVRSIVADIVELYDHVAQRRERLAEIKSLRPDRQSLVDDVYSEEVEQDERDLEREIVRLRGFVAELQGLGAELKDPTIGLVDFRAKLEDREVCLCWKLGEDEIGFWHDVDAGFGGRQPLLVGAATGDGTTEDVTDAEA
ncbi:MAG: DUF2203 domain-containing protein [Planctomycetota bacterium]|nr:DUF2203 domain-containing protein [Planctomycetota bacterium]